VAYRISQCLTKRSILCNYDDDNAFVYCYSKGDTLDVNVQEVLFDSSNSSSVMESTSASTSASASASFPFTPFTPTPTSASTRHTNTLATNAEGNNDGADDVQERMLQGLQKQQSKSLLLSSSSSLPSDQPAYNMDMNLHNINGGNGCVVFLIQLYRGDAKSHEHIHAISSTATATTRTNSNINNNNNNNNKSNTNNVKPPNFSHGIIIECMRIRGSTIQFHKDCRAILSSARGDSNGLNDLNQKESKYHVLYNSPFSFGRFYLSNRHCKSHSYRRHHHHHHHHQYNKNYFY